MPAATARARMGAALGLGAVIDEIQPGALLGQPLTQVTSTFITSVAATVPTPSATMQSCRGEVGELSTVTKTQVLQSLRPRGGSSPTWVASRNPPQSCRNGACSRTYRATSRPCCSPTVQARRKWIPTNMRENAFSRAASNTLS